ncbi:MAG: DUF294 nucleotidyltransferase-like domain-containing protein [Rhodobacteraceae bacterium]|nr:DUF294 nucleotidyltransferase-like domain-containing protein [Paracoccaceae bacterium]
MSFAPPPEDLARLPLASLQAVTFDVETTGLNTAQARVVEIAGMRIHPSIRDRFETLVDPELPIPARATEIHGISDRDVHSAPGFATAMGRFVKWAGPALFLGYGSDFDLAVLRSEHQRRDMLWTPPRVLDLSRLVPLLPLSGGSVSLEAVAESLGIRVEGRHRALADAKLTTELFLKLVPLLRDAGLFTFAQAERAARNAPDVTPLLRTEQVPKSVGLTRIDSFPYRNRVQDVMSAPPVFADAGDSLSACISKMATEGVTSLFIRTDDPGIITESDILRAIDSVGADALRRPVGNYCSQPLISVSHREFLYRAIAEAASRQIRHLAVTDETGNLVGALTARDMLGGRGSGAVLAGQGIATAGSPQELGRVWSELPDIARALLREGSDARAISAVISRELRALTRRACELAEAELGTPPVPYAFLVLGSGGRGESLLAMDQDNAVLYADDATGEDDRWFADLGLLVSEILDLSGVRFCDGGVMGSNAEWRRSAGEWRHEIELWMRRTNPGDILHADIFFDAFCVHGDASLAASLQSHARETAAEAKPFLRLLARRACEFDKPHGLFGRWRLDDSGRIDLKKSGIMPIFSAARTAALETGISHRSTLRRLRALKRIQPDRAAACDDLEAAHGILMSAILTQQLRDLDAGIKLSSRIVPADLDRLETEQIKWALARVPQVATLLGVPSL